MKITLPRYEHKIFLENSLNYSFESYIRTMPYFFSREFNDRYINSIYFDSENLSCLNNNINGVSHRFKIRLRWYNDLKKIKKSNLEIKIKSGLIGTKERIPSIRDLDLNQLKYTSLLKKISKNLPVEKELFFRNYDSPIVLIRYKRSYLKSPIKNIRMTLDSDLQYFNQQNSSFVNLRNKNWRNKCLIFELKGDQGTENELQEIMQYIPFKRTKFSKYLDGYQLSNTFIL